MVKRGLSRNKDHPDIAYLERYAHESGCTPFVAAEHRQFEEHLRDDYRIEVLVCWKTP